MHGFSPGGHSLKNSVPAKIGVVASLRSLTIIPSLQGLLETLAGCGYRLDIYAWDDISSPVEIPLPINSRLFLLAQQASIGSATWRWQFLRSWVPFLYRQCLRERYGCLLGVDAHGLVLAGIPARLVGTPLVYLSLDLFFLRTATSPYHKILKWLEILLNRSTALTIVQDADRAKLLAQENRISLAQVLYLPNAPPGKANAVKTKILRETLGIEDGRRIVLHAGSIDWWTNSLDLARAASCWPDNLAMVFHVPIPLRTEYQQAFLAQIDGRHTYLNQRSLQMNQLIELIRSADIGMALYPVSEDNKNIFTMGFSSGKIAHYLQCGLPVVTTGLPTLRNFIERYHCGICIDRVEEVLSAVQTIINNYESFSRGAIDCFNQEFNLQWYLPAIAERFGKLSGFTAPART